MTNNKSNLSQLIPVMLCFFAMGFVDLVGTASNYVQKDLNLSDSVANTLPSLVFFWFLIFSVPTGMLMNRIGRKKTVLLSLVITAVSLLIPMFADNFALMLVAFSLLGIGNTVMQVSLNPLVSNIITGERLASTMTFGQFVKAIASFMAPIIAAWGANLTAPIFGLGWKMLFPIYLIIGILATICLGITSIKEQPLAEKSASFADCLRLLGVPVVLLSFIGVMCHVGIDVGTNTVAPKLMMERVGMTLEQAGFATSVYFIFRTLGCLTGSFILAKFDHRKFFIVSVLMMAASMVLMFVGKNIAVLYAAFALVGYGNSNIFSLCFSRALLFVPEDRQNDVSGLIIMGLFGGTIFPLLMGFASDAIGQAGAVLVMTVGVCYLAFYSMKMKKS